MSSNSPHNFYQNRFQYPASSSGGEASQYSPNNQRGGGNFRKSFNQTPNSANSPSGPPRFHSPNFGNNGNTYAAGNSNQAGVSLFIKANNVSEDLLRSLFGANVSGAKILSIDVKTK